MSKALYAAMSKAFPEIEGAVKDSANPHFKSKYADLSSVVDAIKPALVKNGLFFSQVNHEQTGGVCVETIVCHESGEQMSFGKLFVPASKQDAQGYGSALTYARRYSLMTAFGVCPEDDDGNAASRSGAPANSNYHSGEALIDDAQFAELSTLAEQTSADAKAFCRLYKIASVNQLPASKFQDARDYLARGLKVGGAR